MAFFSYHRQWTNLAYSLIENNSKFFKIEAVKERDTEILKTIICHPIGRGINIIIKCWGSYDRSDNPIFGYRRIIHINEQHYFWLGPDSTSHIESVWLDLKRLLTKNDNTTKEYEFLKKIIHLNNRGKILQLIKKFTHIANTVENELFWKD